MPRRKKTLESNENSNMKVVPIRPLEIKDDTDYHPNLPKITRNNGSISLLLGPTSCGKTSVINWLLLNSNAWGGKKSAFENVYIFSPSVECDDSCRFLREYFECYTEYKDEYLKAILDKQESFPKKERPKGMIVIDDSVGNSAMKRGGTLQAFLSRYRHWNMNVIMSVQSFRALSTIARANATNILLFNGIYNSKEFEKIEEEFDDMYKCSLKKCYNTFAANKYDFLHLKLRENPPEMYKGFQQQINYNVYGKKDLDDDVGEKNEEMQFEMSDSDSE